MDRHIVGDCMPPTDIDVEAPLLPGEEPGEEDILHVLRVGQHLRLPFWSDA